jgi:hypothetical protein
MRSKRSGVIAVPAIQDNESVFSTTCRHPAFCWNYLQFMFERRYLEGVVQLKLWMSKLFPQAEDWQC